MNEPTEKTFLLTGNGNSADLHIAWAIASSGGRVRYALPSKQIVANAHSTLKKIFEHYGNSDAIGAVETRHLDILDRDVLAEIMHGCHNVIHTQAFHSADFTSPEELWRHNVEGARTLCDVALADGTPHLVVMTPVYLLSPTADGKPVNEETPYMARENRSECERSLFRREMEFAKAAEQGIRTTSILSGLPIGPGGQLADELEGLTGKAVANVTTGFVDARDLAELILMMCNDETTEPQRRLICVGVNTSYADVHNALRPTPLSATQRLARRLREVLPWTRSAQTQTTDFSNENATYSSEKITRLTGHTFRTLQEATANILAFGQLRDIPSDKK